MNEGNFAEQVEDKKARYNMTERLEEIENEGIINDIANQFAGNSWDSSKNWTYSCFAKEKNSSIGCAVLSKYPLFGIKTHSLDIRTQKDSQPSMRPIMEVNLDVGGRNVILFVNHFLYSFLVFLLFLL